MRKCRERHSVFVSVLLFGEKIVVYFLSVSPACFCICNERNIGGCGTLKTTLCRPYRYLWIGTLEKGPNSQEIKFRINQFQVEN